MKFNYCLVCKKFKIFQSFRNRGYVRCSGCGSLERHRFLYSIYKKYFLNSCKKIKLLHTAPEKCFVNSILKNKNIEYTPIDLDPSRYPYIDCKKEDVLKMSFVDNTFDVIISNHVMEHVDDKKFMSELIRVLKPGGTLLLSFPIFFDTEFTFEHPAITSPSDREKIYGQDDHVRRYGLDIFNILKEKYGAVTISSKKLSKKPIDCNKIVFKITKS